MEKILLARKISVIHAIKCANAVKSETAKASSDYLSSLMDKLNNAENASDLRGLDVDINYWAGANPIATDNEISSLMNLANRK